MDYINERSRTGFPSDFVDPKTKASKEYSLKMAEAVDLHSLSMDNGFYRGAGQTNQFTVNRAYARAQQPVDKYKPILGVKDKKTRNDPSALAYKVLSWENLGFLPKFINVLIGELMSQNNTVGVKAVDAKAQSDRRKKRMSFEEWVTNKAFLDNITAQTGIAFESPAQDDVIPLPENLGEIPLHMEMFYKEEYCLIVQDMLLTINQHDNWQNTMAETFRDLLETGFGVTRTFRMQNKVMRRHSWPERMVMSSTTSDTAEDIKYIGEYWDLTIGRLKELAGNQFTEAEYKEIAEKNNPNANWNEVNTSEYFAANFCYPWDNTKITVLDLVWWSPDWNTYKVWRNELGNVFFDEKKYSWWNNLEKKGMTEEKYNKESAGGNQVIREKLDNQYQCMWIKGTKHVFNYGKAKDMLRNEAHAGRCYGPYTVYRMKNCITELLIPIIDNIQINWLQYQHHAAKSRPAGLDVEFSALQDIGIEGAGGKKLTPKQILQVYFDTGILLWRRRDATGAQSNWRPINELDNGLNSAVKQHYENIVAGINMLRDIAGLNELTDASTPNSEMGKAVATMAVGATKKALKSLHFAADQIVLGTAEKTVMHITGMAQGGIAPMYAEALGLDDMARLALLSDLSMHELGVYMLKEPSEEMALRLSQYIAEGTKPGGYLYPEEAFEIENEPNIYRKIRLLKMYRQQKQRSAQKEKQADMQNTTQAQIESAQATNQMEMDKAQMEVDGKIKVAWETAKAQAWADKQRIANEAFLLNVKNKLDTKQELTLEEANRMTELMKIDRQGQYQIEVAKVKPPPPKGPSKKKAA